MKFVRHGKRGKERPGVLDPRGRIRDIGHLVADIGGGVPAQLSRFDAVDLKDVDGHRYQSGSTATMIFSAPYLVSYISQFMSLHPGDIISTGTPPGVGLGQSPPVYLKPGQIMRVGIEKLGEQLQKTVAYDPRSHPLA